MKRKREHTAFNSRESKKFKTRHLKMHWLHLKPAILSWGGKLEHVCFLKCEIRNGVLRTLETGRSVLLRYVESMPSSLELPNSRTDELRTQLSGPKEEADLDTASLGIVSSIPISSKLCISSLDGFRPMKLRLRASKKIENKQN